MWQNLYTNQMKSDIKWNVSTIITGDEKQEVLCCINLHFLLSQPMFLHSRKLIMFLMCVGIKKYYLLYTVKSELPLFPFLVHGLILNKISTCALLGGSDYWWLQRRLQRQKQALFIPFIHTCVRKSAHTASSLTFLTSSSSSASLSCRESLLARWSPASLYKGEKHAKAAVLKLV